MSRQALAVTVSYFTRQKAAGRYKSRDGTERGGRCSRRSCFAARRSPAARHFLSCGSTCRHSDFLDEGKEILQHLLFDQFYTLFLPLALSNTSIISFLPFDSRFPSIRKSKRFSCEAGFPHLPKTQNSSPKLVLQRAVADGGIRGTPIIQEAPMAGL